MVMDNIFKKSFKILLILLVINVAIAFLYGSLVGETNPLSFEKVDSPRPGVTEEYTVSGFLSTSLFFILILVVYILLFFLFPPVVNLLAKIPITESYIKTVSKIFGARAVEDISLDPKIYSKKVLSTIFIYAGIVLILLNFIILGNLQNIFLIVLFFILVIVGLFFLNKVYNLI